MSSTKEMGSFFLVSRDSSVTEMVCGERRALWPINQLALCAPSPPIRWLACVPSSGPRCSRIDEVRFKTPREAPWRWWLHFLRTSRRPAWNPARNMAEKRKPNVRTGGTTIDHNVGVSYGDLEKECNPFQLSLSTLSLFRFTTSSGRKERKDEACFAFLWVDRSNQEKNKIVTIVKGSMVEEDKQVEPNPFPPYLWDSWYCLHTGVN